MAAAAQRELQLEDQLLVLRQENETLINRLGVARTAAADGRP